jgi:hypothetical protein
MSFLILMKDAADMAASRKLALAERREGNPIGKRKSKVFSAAGFFARLRSES